MDNPEKRDVIESTKNVVRETWEAFKYEVEINFNKLKKEKFWMYTFMALTIFFLLVNKRLPALASIVVMLILKMKFDKDTGKLKDYIRKKQGIPNKYEIKRMAESRNHEI